MTLSRFFFVMQALDKRENFTTKHSLDDIRAFSEAKKFAIRFKSIKRIL